MGTVRVRYVRQKGGTFYFEATKAMREAGFGSRPLGDDPAQAFAQAQEILAAWDAHRLGLDEPTYMPGTFRWIIKEFERSSWYGDLTERTREETDRHLGIINGEWGKVRVASIERKHCRQLHDRRTEAAGRDHANRTIKWLRRLLHYAMELGVIRSNPASNMGLKQSRGRRVRWTRAEVDSFVKTANKLGYPSWGLAIRIAYETSQRPGDVLKLTWHDYDGEGFTFRPGKTQDSGTQEIWSPLTAKTNAALKRVKRRSIYVIVGDTQGKPIRQRGHFNKIFRKIKTKAKLRAELQARDLRRTAASEVDEGGGKVEPLTGHRPGSSALKTYVVPSKDAARAAQKARKWDTK